MAQVNYNDGVPTTSPGDAPPNDYSSVRATPDEFGGNIDQGITQVGAGMSKAGQYFGQVQTDDAINTALTASNKALADFKALNGGEALRARPATEDAINTAIKNGREGLDTPEQQHAYDQATRSYQQRYFSGQITSHADQQAKIFAAQTNQNSLGVALNGVANVADDDDAIQPFLHDARDAAVKSVQAAGNGDDPAQVNSAIQRADAAVYKTQAQAIAVKDPARALAIIDKHKDVIGAEYPQLANSFRTRADLQVGNAAGQKAFQESYSGPRPTSNTALVAQLDPIGQQYGISGSYLARTHQLEDANNSPTVNSAGAAGPFQFIPSTAAKYGLTNRFDFQQSADAAARLAADNRRQFIATAGRAPTDAELYLTHQQGAHGALNLLMNPNVRAGSLVGDAAIRQNGGDPNAPASAFTSMWARKYNGATGVVSAQAKQSAYQRVMDDPSLNDAQRQHALTYISQQAAAHDIADNDSLKARKAASDQAANQYMTKILSGPADPNMTDSIANDPNLEWRTKDALSAAAQKHSGSDLNEAQAAYGPGFWSAYKGVTAATDDPSRIADVTPLLQRAGPGGDLTLAGVQKLVQTMTEGRKDVTGASINSTKTGLFNYAKSQLSFEQDTGPIKIRDPKGEALFNSQFIPKFESGYDQWVKAGKNPWEYLSKENVDKMLTGMRSKSQMAQDRLVATGEAAPGAPDEPIPPPPQGINPEGWGAVLSAPPKTESGAPFPKAIWGRAVKMLADNPTPENIDRFNKSKFGRAGLDGNQIIQQLTGKAEPPKPAAPHAPLFSLDHGVRFHGRTVVDMLEGKPGIQPAEAP